MAGKYKNQVRPFLTIPRDFWEVAEELDEKQSDEILKAIYYYDHYEKEPEFSNKTTKLFFKDIKRAMDAGRERYENKCEQQRARRSAGSKKAALIEEINEFFEMVSIYEYAHYMKTDSTKVDRFLEVMEELRVSELEEFLENTRRYNEHMIQEIRETGTNITPFQSTGTE